MHYLDLLRRLHEELRPAGYLEIGVGRGDSLRLSRARTVAIDPAPQPHAASLRDKPALLLYVGASDDFFRELEPEGVLAGAPLDLAFVDGLHEFTQVVRDLEHIERWGHAGTVVAVHDVLPRTVGEASRVARAGAWTGDVWRLVAFLERHRPDLRCWLTEADPTGMLIVTQLDPGHTGMSHLATAENRTAFAGTDYDEAVGTFMRDADPLPAGAVLAMVREDRRGSAPILVAPSRQQMPRQRPDVWLHEPSLGDDFFASMGVSGSMPDGPAEVVPHGTVFFEAATGIALDGGGEVIRENFPQTPDTPHRVAQIEAMRERVASQETIEVGRRGPFALLPTPRHDNYFHFLFDDLGRLGFYEALETCAALRFPIPLPRPWQRELYALARIERRLLPLPSGVVALRDVWIAPRGLARIEEFRSRAFYRVRALADQVPDGMSPGPRRIYVSREATGHRRLTNDAEVRRRAEAHGFAVVLPESLPIVDQIRLFRGADVVLGGFGAGLANAAFMRPGGTLLEIAPSRPETPPVVHNAIFSSLAGAVGLRYGLLSAPSAALDEETHDFAAPIDWLDALLERMLDAPADPAQAPTLEGHAGGSERERKLGAAP